MKKIVQLLFENQQCQKSNGQKMSHLETNTHVSPTTLKDM
jgi:hypothetical protein